MQFADLHDTAGRMKHKGVIVDVIAWKRSRAFFYDRLRRKLALATVYHHLHLSNPSLTVSQMTSMVRRWLFEAQKQAYLWEDDKAVVEWIDKQLMDNGETFKKDSYIQQQIDSECSDHLTEHLRAANLRYCHHRYSPLHPTRRPGC